MLSIIPLVTSGQEQAYISPARKIRPTKTHLATFIFFWGLYCALGVALALTEVLSQFDVLFLTDAPRVLENLTSTQPAFYHNMILHRHPMFILFFNFIGVIIAKITGSGMAAGIIINSFAGAGCVTLAQIFFEKAGLTRSHCVLYSLILGFSASHLFFSAVPETFIFGAGALILLYILALSYPGNLLYFVGAGVLNLGITTSNVVHSAIVYFFSIYKKNFTKQLAFDLLKFFSYVLAGSIVLNILQKLIYSDTILFFLPQFYQTDAVYTVLPRQAPDLILRAIKLTGYIFLYNFVAPAVYVGRFADPGITPWVSFEGASLHRPELFDRPFYPIEMDWSVFQTPAAAIFKLLGLLAGAVWILLIIWGVYNFCRRPQTRSAITTSFIFCVLFNLLFHFFYGNELFIYSTNWTFFVLGWLALGLNGAEEKFAKIHTGALIAFLILQVINNGHFFYKLSLIYR